MADYLDYWYINYVVTNLAYNIQVDYAEKIRAHLKSTFGKYRLAALETDTIQKWINNMKCRWYSHNMIENTRSCLSGALNYAVYPCKYIKYNPCDYSNIPKIAIPENDEAHTE